MKCYFDNANINEANMSHLKTGPNGESFWLIPEGTNLKKQLVLAGIKIDTLDNLTESGCYFIEVNGDPIWWTGIDFSSSLPRNHVLREIPIHVLDLARCKKLRLVIAADREGGGFIYNNKNAFAETTRAMQDLGLPVDSVLIVQGNYKIQEQYGAWLIESGSPKLFSVKHMIHFDRIFFHKDVFPADPIINQSLANPEVTAFNSLNRVSRPHRLAHLYMLARDQLLDSGMVSCNELNCGQADPLEILSLINDKTTRACANYLISDFDNYMRQHFPRHVDGDWAQINAANTVHESVFKNSLLSFVSETKFQSNKENVVFITEKIFKCLAYGHPMILLASAHTLRALEQLGFRIDYCSINPYYNDIENDIERFYATYSELVSWIQLSKEEKIRRIKNSMPTIMHNFYLCRKINFYHTGLRDIMTCSEEYLNA